MLHIHWACFVPLQGSEFGSPHTSSWSSCYSPEHPNQALSSRSDAGVPPAQDVHLATEVHTAVPEPGRNF